MEEKVRALMERFPGRADVIKALSETSSQFTDLIGDYHDVGEALARMDQAEQESEAGMRSELERRRANLEEELLLLLQSHPRV